jgi:hypothetical protein
VTSVSVKCLQRGQLKLATTLQEISRFAAVLEGFSGGFEPPQHHIATVAERSLILASAAPTATVLRTAAQTVATNLTSIQNRRKCIVNRREI